MRAVHDRRAQSPQRRDSGGSPVRIAATWRGRTCSPHRPWAAL